MRKRPIWLFFCSLLFSYFPLELLHEILQGYEPGPIDFILYGVLPGALMYGLIRVTRLGWYTLVAMVTLLGMRDLHVFYQAQGADSQLWVHLFIYAISVTYFINPRIRHLYFDPKLRWWRVKRRYETHLPFLFTHQSLWHYPILRNISESGCFVETAHPIDVSETIQIALPLPSPIGVSVLKVAGDVKWVSTHPDRRGMGVQFLNLTPQTQRVLKEFMRQQ